MAESKSVTVGVIKQFKLPNVERPMLNGTYKRRTMDYCK